MTHSVRSLRPVRSLRWSRPRRRGAAIAIAILFGVFTTVFVGTTAAAATGVTAVTAAPAAVVTEASAVPHSAPLSKTGNHPAKVAVAGTALLVLVSITAAITARRDDLAVHSA